MASLEIRYARVGNAENLYVATFGAAQVTAPTVEKMVEACKTQFPDYTAADVRRLCKEARKA